MPVVGGDPHDSKAAVSTREPQPGLTAGPEINAAGRSQAQAVITKGSTKASTDTPAEGTWTEQEQAPNAQAGGLPRTTTAPAPKSLDRSEVSPADAATADSLPPKSQDQGIQMQQQQPSPLPSRQQQQQQQQQQQHQQQQQPSPLPSQQEEEEEQQQQQQQQMKKQKQQMQKQEEEQQLQQGQAAAIGSSKEQRQHQQQGEEQAETKKVKV